MVKIIGGIEFRDVLNIVTLIINKDSYPGMYKS